MASMMDLNMLVMLPGRDGFEVATALRKAGNIVPILMLTARGRPDDVLRGVAFSKHVSRPHQENRQGDENRLFSGLL